MNDTHEIAAVRDDDAPPHVVETRSNHGGNRPSGEQGGYPLPPAAVREAGPVRTEVPPPPRRARARPLFDQVDADRTRTDCLKPARCGPQDGKDSDHVEKQQRYVQCAGLSGRGQ